VAVGLNKTPSDKGEEAKISYSQQRADAALVQWVQQKSKGEFGVAVIVPSAQPTYAEDSRNSMMIAPASSGQPLRYYVGAAWTRGGEITTREAWQRYVSDEAARLRAPVSVSVNAR
jgi:hypothetical protein